MRIHRQRATSRRQLIDVPVEIQKENAMELEKVQEGMVPSLEKTKFGRTTIEDMESMSSALAYRSNSWSNLAFSMQVYRYTLVVYRYTFTTVDFLHMCTGTHLGCTGTLCPLPLFMQGVPVHFYDVPVHLVLWCFPCIAGVPETSSIVRPHSQCFILASRT